MHLTVDQARRIERGDRTTIRVPVDRRLTATPLRPARKGHAKPFVPVLSELLPIAHPVTRTDSHGGPDKNGWETLCFTRIMDVQRRPLGVLTDEEAQAEGYDTADEFKVEWTRRYDRDWFARQVRQLVEADTDLDDAVDTTALMALNRWSDRWARREVWVITVRVEADLTYSLAPAARPKGDTGYVLGGSDVLEAGVVQPVASLDQKWARRAARRQLEALAETASPEERSRRARALARRVRELALQDPRLARQIEELVRDAEKKAA